MSTLIRYYTTCWQLSSCFLYGRMIEVDFFHACLVSESDHSGIVIDIDNDPLPEYFVFDKIAFTIFHF